MREHCICLAVLVSLVHCMAHGYAGISGDVEDHTEKNYVCFVKWYPSKG